MPDRPEPSMSEAAREFKSVTRIALMIAGLALMLVFAGAKGWVPPSFGRAAWPLFLASAITAIWMGTKAHNRALADREMQSSRAMIVAIAAQLGKQDDGKLIEIQRRGGPAGEAAGMILQGRKDKAARASAATVVPPESSR